MALRVILNANIRPPIALDPKGVRYFSDKVGFNLQESFKAIAKPLEDRIANRIETEQFGQPTPRPHPWSGTHAEHTGQTVGTMFRTISVIPGGTATPVKGLVKSEGIKIYMRHQRMPWPLMTNWPIGVPSGLRGAFKIRPRKDRISTAHTRTKSGGKSKRKRLVFRWNNANVTFFGKEVYHPGFGSRDILTEELLNAKNIMVSGAQSATRKSVLEWTQGGKAYTTTKTAIRR